MKNRCVLFSLVFISLISCSSTNTCKTNADCSDATQTCQAGSCQTQTASNCKTSAVCATGYACNATTSQCSCVSNTHCSTGEGCIASKCAFRRAFTTSVIFTSGTAYNKTSSPKTFSSDADADTACNDLGSTKYPGTKWAAWIATSAKSAISRIIPSRIADGDTANVYLVDGKTQVSGPVTMTKAKGNFASSCNGTTDTQIDCPDAHDNPINKDESGNNLTQGLTQEVVYTGITTSDFDLGLYTCDNWGSMDSLKQFTEGDHLSKNRNWHSANNLSCGNPGRLYCLEVNQ